MKKSKAVSALTNSSKNILSNLGSNILVAIKRRKLKRQDVADQALMSLPTLRAIIKGDPTVGIGCYLAVLSVINLEDDLEKVADPRNDEIGMELSIRDLPKTIRTKRSKYDF